MVRSLFAAILLLVACTAAPFGLPPPVVPATEPKPLATVTMAEALALHHVAEPVPAIGPSAQLAPRGAVLAATAVASYEIRYPPTLCVMPQVTPPSQWGDPATYAQLPFVSCRGVGPQVGVPWTVDAWTQAAADVEQRIMWLKPEIGREPTIGSDCLVARARNLRVLLADLCATARGVQREVAMPPPLEINAAEFLRR
jgi:hypothetical protein